METKAAAHERYEDARCQQDCYEMLDCALCAATAWPDAPVQALWDHLQERER
jgi:hypothetical protein